MSVNRPELKELPSIVDAGSSGIRLANTLPKALPPIDQAGSGTSARQMADAELKRDMAIAFAETKAMAARSKAIQRIRDQQYERRARDYGLKR